MKNVGLKGQKKEDILAEIAPSIWIKKGKQMATSSKERPTVVQRLSDPTIEPGYLSLKTPIKQSYPSRMSPLVLRSKRVNLVRILDWT